MATETARVDVGALTNSLFEEAVSCIANTVVLTIDWCNEDGCELNERQKVQFVRTALIAASGLEVHFAEQIKTTLEQDGVATWGLDQHLEQLLSGERA